MSVATYLEYVEDSFYLPSDILDINAESLTVEDVADAILLGLLGD